MKLMMLSISIAVPFFGYYQIENMTGKLKDATRNNPDLKIKIYYGIKDTDSKGIIKRPETIIKARELVPKLKQALGDALKIKETNTHVKIVIVDDRKYMLGSANVMSFSGDYRHGDTRSEIMICSENTVHIKELKKKYFSW